MESGNFYFDFSENTKKDAAINNLLSRFLQSREKAKFPSNSVSFDEDVNLYISHLLFAIAMPNYNNITAQYISLNSSEINVLVDMAEDKYLKYFIYKVNADNLLVHLGIFHDLHYRTGKGQPKGLDSYISDAKNYYIAAAQLNRKIYHRKTAIADVLIKIAKYLDSYIKALSLMRKDFYHFLTRFEDNEFCGFLDSMKGYEKKMELEQKQNLFLDMYNQWLKSKNSVLKAKINVLCKELHQLDPLFKFKLD